MAEGRSRMEWSRTAAVLALLANVHRDPKRPAFKPADFDPHASQDRRNEPRAKVKLSEVKDVLLGFAPTSPGRKKREPKTHGSRAGDSGR